VGKNQTLSVTCLAESPGDKARTRSVSIGPNQSLLIDACAEGGAAILSSLRNLPKPATGRKAVAVSVSSSVAAMNLAVFGLGASGIGHDGGGLVAIPFTNSHQLASSTAVYPGVTSAVAHPLGVQAAVANFGTSAHQATILLSDGSGPGTQRAVATLNLAPGSISLVDLTGVISRASTNASLVVTADGAPGEVISGIQALGQPNTPSASVTLPWKDLKQTVNGGQHPWTIGGGVTSTVMLFNPDAKTANSVTLSIHAGKNTWSKKIAIAPLSTVAVRINDIISRQEPDDKKNTLPRGSVEGMVGWFTLAMPRIFGLLSQNDPAGGSDKIFACGDTIVLCSMSLFDTDVSVGDTATLWPTISSCGTDGDCNCVLSCSTGGSLSRVWLSCWTFRHEYAKTDCQIVT